MMKQFLAKISEGEHLSQEEASRAFQIVMNGGATPAQIAALLMGLRRNGETVAEISGAAFAIRSKMETLTAPEGAIDVCGTGGDAARQLGGTLNVSTAVALVVAACGVPIVKHGNKSVSSKSGSADVLQALGVNIRAEKILVEQCINEAGMGFMFAPLYHAAMRHVAPVRQELGIRTLFNLLGPLVNPAAPKFQLIGVYDKTLLVPIAEVLRELGTQKAWVVHGSDGMDELTITGHSDVVQLDNGIITGLRINPEEYGLPLAHSDALKGNDAYYNAKELSLLLAGKKSAYRDVVMLNAAAALFIAGKVETLSAGHILAAEVLDNGKAKEILAVIVRITQSVT